MKFLKCSRCGNTITYISEGGGEIVCCGQKMDELKPNTTDAATEKHVPVVSVNGSTVTVTVGSVPHPMLAEHHIEWIALETESGVQIKHLNVEGKPEAVFALVDGDTVKQAYAYCNLHGLWRN